MNRLIKNISLKLLCTLLAFGICGCSFIRVPSESYTLNGASPLPKESFSSSPNTPAPTEANTPSDPAASYTPLFSYTPAASSTPFAADTALPAVTVFPTPVPQPATDAPTGAPHESAPAWTQTPGPSGMPQPDSSPMPTPTFPIITPEATQAPTPLPTPMPPRPVFTTPDPELPIDQITPGDQRVFDYCAFFGNSLFHALYYRGIVTHGTFYTRSGLDVNTAYTEPAEYGYIPIINELNSGSFSGVLLMFGQNELGWAPRSFIGKYSSLIADVHSKQPNAIIFVAGLPPVTRLLSETSTDGTTNENVVIFNRLILELASRFDFCRFIAPPASMYTSDGYLPEKASRDGLHLNDTYSRIWAEHLCYFVGSEFNPHSPIITPSPTPEITPSPTPEITLPFPIITPTPGPEPTPKPTQAPPITPSPLPILTPEPSPIVTPKPHQRALIGFISTALNFKAANAVHSGVE